MGNKIKDLLEKIDDYHWVIPKKFQSGMLVPGLLFADEKLLNHIIRDEAFKQVANVAHLPGIVKYSMAMPDIHWGYGLPIGGVAPIKVSGGVVSPGGVGSDINCGVRLIRTDIKYKSIANKIGDLIDGIFKNIPCGIGSTGKIKLSQKELPKVLINGAKWAVDNGYGWLDDLEYCEEGGMLSGANPDALSNRAKFRGLEQLGTLGAGNHFLEIQRVEKVFDNKAAESMGLFEGQLTVMVHTGSRGLGYQVCEDSVKKMMPVMAKYGISVPDRQLACAPLDSKEGKLYLGAMASAANYAWANRQCITHWVRETFEEIFKVSAASPKLNMRLVYDVAHNIGKFETHRINGDEIEIFIHRKGATRAFGPHHPDIPKEYTDVGQPVIIPGDMGTASYVLAGTERAMTDSFGSTCHGAGRMMSRRQAIKSSRGRDIVRELQDKGIYVKAKGWRTLHEEMSDAYKDINDVVEVVVGAGISKKIAKMIPVGVAKG
ncbi:RtcB family protein [bacterium]|nr:RtcB family protein [bacterium]